MVRMRFAFTILLVGILFLSFVTVFYPIETCSAAGNTIYVDDSGGKDYETIMGAISAANQSDTIYVYSGTYQENIVISKTLTLTGEDKDNTIIEGDSTGHVIEITSNSVNISGFKIRNAIGSGYDCIMMNQVKNCKITNNNIENSDDGIYLLDSDGNTISWNTIKNNNASGIRLSYSSSNTIQGNTVQNNDKGITLHSSSNNVISGNTIKENNLYGIRLWPSANSNNIVDNTISDNGDTGIYVASSANNNDIYHNSFLGNTLNAYDTGSNNWDDGSEGNYWDDYTGYDNDGDGIGNISYDISGGSNQDRYPLGFFTGENQKPTADAGGPYSGYVEQSITFDGSGSTDDNSVTDYRWDFDNDGNYDTGWLATPTTTHIYDASGTYTVKLEVKDNEDETDTDTAQVTITVEGKKPTATIVKPNIASAIYGETVDFHGYGLPSEGMITEFNWRSSKDGVLSSLVTFTKSGLSVGTHAIYFKVKDVNGWSDEVSVNLVINPDQSSPNEPPVADAGGPYSGYVNVSLSFDASGSYDPDEDEIVSYVWDFGDGTNGTGVTVGHTYNSSGNYTVNLTVTDSQGKTAIISTYANVSLQPTDQNGNGEEDDGFPGFELIFVIIASVIVLFWIKKRKGS